MVVPSACNEANVGDIAPTVLMPGDPLRAKYVAETYLKGAVRFNAVRNMFGYTGEYVGKRVSVMGSGMGIPSMGLYAHELFAYFGVQNVIRIGTAGGLKEGVGLRDIVIAMAASTDSAFANQFDFPGTLAATADFGLIEKAVAAARERKVRVHVGQVFSSDHFYNARPGVNEAYRKMGMLAVEMETAGLYLTAMGAGRKALSILTISDLPLTGEGLSAQERQESFKDMMEIALALA